jgi:hypothetical protein
MNFSKERNKKISKALKGRKLSEEHKRNLSNALKGKKKPPRSEEYKRKLSNAKKGERHPFFGKHHSEETKRKMSNILKGKKKPPRSEEHKKKISEALKGEKSSLWKGGISFEPYSTDWTETLRRSIRERDHYLCQLCWNEGYPVHHIDYCKKNCNPLNLITLCKSCHDKTNHNRKKWKRFFREGNLLRGRQMQ